MALIGVGRIGRRLIPYRESVLVGIRQVDTHEDAPLVLGHHRPEGGRVNGGKELDVALTRWERETGRTAELQEAE